MIISGPGLKPANVSSTNSSGSSTLDLLPWNYSVTLFLHGSLVANESLVFSSSQTLAVAANVYRVYIDFMDALGHPVPDADVVVIRGSSAIQGTTSQDGLFSFEAVPYGVYNATVSVGGKQYYSGNIRATANDMSVQLKSTYYPSTFTLILLGGILGGIALAGFVFYSIRKQPRFLSRK
jgi:hypothetical protein